jgi:3-oxoacyl-[acyl-carrier-protein] synthase-3
MSGHRVFLSAPCYVLGETEVAYGDIEGMWERAEEFDMVLKPELWGWGSVRRTEKSLQQLAIETGRSTIEAADVDPSSVDMLLLCSTQFPGSAETHGQFVQTVMAGLGLESADFAGVTLNRCTNLLATLRVAQAFVSSGLARRILVITTDRITDEALRVKNFALFSDGSASCLVGAEPTGPHRYELVASASATDASSLDWSNEISSDLAKQVNEQLLGPRGLRTQDLAGLSQANLYRPVVVMKELQAGFSPGQIHTANIARVGHCFAADPLINLVDRQSSGQVCDGGLHLLAASVPGARLAVLLRRVAVPAPDQTRPPTPHPGAAATTSTTASAG